MKTALIIDDESDYRLLLARFLQRGAWHVFEAEDGESGISAARQHKPDVIICDVFLNNADGLEICRRLRAEASLQRTGILMSSGHDEPKIRRIAIEAGADGFLPKPFKPKQLLQVVADCANWGAPSPASEQAQSQPTSRNRFQFWGVRGSIPTPGFATARFGGNTSCVEVRADGQIIILDAGTGLRLLGKQLITEFGDRPLEVTLLLTHTHWDHIQGLPFFAPLHRPGSRIRILGYEGACHGLQAVLSAQMESPFFPISLHQTAGNVRVEELRENKFEVGAVKISAFKARHPGVCFGYRLSTSSGSIAYLPDNESRPPGMMKAPEIPDEDLVEFLRGTETLILDAQYDSSEYERHAGWGHGCVDDAVMVAIAAGAKRLFLFHHDPDHDDTRVAEMAGHARELAASSGIALEIEAAREGLQVEF